MDMIEIARDFMVKKSVGKSSITPFTKDNYKSRWFHLYTTHLKYYNGTLQAGKKREKGQVNLSKVLVVEEVNNGALDNAPKGFPFQIVYIDADAGNAQYTLYIIASSESQRNDWIHNLRNECQKQKANLLATYHPGVYNKERRSFSCCLQIDKQAPGCQPTFTQPERQQAIQATNGPTITNGTRNQPSTPTHNYFGSVQQSSPNSSSLFVIALYDFEPSGHDDLQLKRGERYKILDNSMDHWWKAQNTAGQIGFVPANYLQDLVQTPEGLSRFEWYYRNITRHQCETLLKEDGRQGVFLVKDSSYTGLYTISVHYKDGLNGIVKHYHIKQNHEKKYYVSDKHLFETVEELIHYHRHNAAGLVVRLKHPPTTDDSPPSHGLESGTYEIDPKDLEIGAEIGRGQFGMVYKGFYKGKTPVAVKKMQANAMSEEDFIDEAKTMKNLAHKHLVILYGVCTKERPMSIVMEYMKEGSLLTYLRRYKSVILKNTSELIDISMQVCSAMSYLESKNIIHRDLAARNCLVASKNLVKVTDFGLARHVIDDEYTSSSGTKFPIRWAPPEVLGYTRFSSKSDVWAFGVLMHEIFTGGEIPYGMKCRNPEVVEMVVHRGMRLRQPEHCPPDVYNVMFSCWKENREERPSFAALLQDLEQLCFQDYS